VSNAFEVEVSPTNMVSTLKKLIKAEKSPRFDDVMMSQRMSSSSGVSQSQTGLPP